MDDGVDTNADPLFMPLVIATALVKIQKNLKPLIRSRTNLEFGSKFVPLPEVMTKAIDMLNKHGIAVVQPPVTDEHEHIALETSLIHKTGVGYSKTTRLALGKADPQGHASAITYTRRYALMGILGLTSEDDDDDGNKAAGHLLKVTDEQLDRIKSLLKDLRYPREQIAHEIFNIKTSDHADLAILNYEQLISMRMRDVESKTRATKIEVGVPRGGAAVDVEADELTVEQRIENLELKSKAYKNKFINSITGKPMLANCKEADLEELRGTLRLLESGVRSLPDEWYAAGRPPVKPDVVSEPREPGEEAL